MNDNPYRPPSAEVADLMFADGIARPPLIHVATVLLCATLGAGLISLTIQWQDLSSQVPIGLAVFTGLFTFALIGWLSYKLWQGRSWARIVMLVMFVVGAPMSLPQLPVIFTRSPIAAGIFIFQTAAQLGALYIVFLTSARHWFTKSRGAPNKALQATRETLAPER
jgi:hypothetical protein